MRNITAASALVVISTACLVAGVAFWSARKSDQVTEARQASIVAYALDKSVEKIPYDQESVAIWDDAVTNVRNTFNEKWVDVNLGVWMYDYFKHDRVYVIDAQDRVLYKMADGKQQAPASATLPEPALSSEVTALRHAIAAGALDKYESGSTRIPRTTNIALVENRPAIISVMPLVSDTGDLPQERGTEAVIVSVRFLDSNFLSDLAAAYLLDGVRFSRTNDITPREQSYALKSNSGDVVGEFIWRPTLAGSTILSDVMPVLAAGLLLICIAMALLIRRLRGAYTELLTSEAQSKHLAFHDALTGLPNRLLFTAQLEKELAELAGTDHHLAVMFMDLDRFKQVNDTFGHAVGDELIRELAARLHGTLRQGDMLARMGGDEFAVIMLGVRTKQEVETIAKRLIAAASTPFHVLGNQAMVGISIGAAMAPEAGTDRSELARKADIALYEAKNAGRQCVQFFTEAMSATLRERQAMEIELRRALETGTELEVVYQPVYSSTRLEITGVEALARWNHPRLGALSPLIFVALAEECGLIDRLGEWVLSEACRAARAWDNLSVAVNVSPIQFMRPGFASRVLAILAESEMPANRLEIEITEGTLLDSSGTSGKMLEALRRAGVRVALDDFGTGYSSLSYLLKLEVDRIKIDRSFVQHLGSSSQSYSIVEAIVTMAHAVGVSITAEGVETVEQQDFLTAIGCDSLQGYLFSRPLSAEKLAELIGASKAASPADTKAA